MAFPYSIFDHGNQVQLYEVYDVNFFGNNIRTVVTHLPSVVDSWIAEIEIVHRRRLHRLIVGLDLEWRPSFQRGVNDPVATLQLCVGRRCLIFQLIHAPRLPRSLRQFLSYATYTFVGVGIKADATRLERDYGLSVRNAVDLAPLAADRFGSKELKRAGLQKLAMEVLGTHIEKPQAIRTGPWDNTNLTPDQVQYACVDAYVSFEIGISLIFCWWRRRRKAGIVELEFQIWSSNLKYFGDLLNAYHHVN